MLKLLSNLPKNENDLLNFSLDELAKIGAKKILIQALNLEVEQYIDESKVWKDDNGHRMVVRNGKGKKRTITTGSGAIEIKAPRINDKRPGINFNSSILPRYLRKSANIQSVVPLLYLKGLSGNAFKEALEALLGKDGVKGLSPASISLMKKSWTKEMTKWNKEQITDEFVYLWCDGVNVSVRLGEDKRICLLVVIGVNHNGEKKLLAVRSGFKESEMGWKEVFSSLIERGLNSPHLIIGDGGLGLWAAIKGMEHFKNTKEQRCWFHKTLNVLDKLPKKVHSQAKDLLNEIKNAPTKSDAGTALKIFKDVFEPKYPKAYECIDKDWKKLTSFFCFPALHWRSIRTSNPIESAFATVKLRTKVTKGAGSAVMAETMTFKLLRESEKRWRPIRGKNDIQNLLQGALYIDGELNVKESEQQDRQVVA
jgi:putative transposase